MHNLTAQTPPTILFFGTRDEFVPVRTIQAYKARMDQLGRRCELHLYEDQAHGFFNGRKNFLKTMSQMDPFLVSLGYLEAKKDQPPVLLDRPHDND